MISQKLLKECVHYNPLTGEFIWLHRPLSHFKTIKGQRIFNTLFAGKKAGSLHKVNGYMETRISVSRYKLHRLAWLYVYGSIPQEKEIDHKNKIRHDNRIANLRLCSHTDNMKNASLHKNNTSGVNGVCWDKREKRWKSNGCILSKQVHIGYFKNKDQAIEARLKWQKDNGFSDIHGLKLKVVEK